MPLVLWHNWRFINWPQYSNKNRRMTLVHVANNEDDIIGRELNLDQNVGRARNFPKICDQSW